MHRHGYVFRSEPLRQILITQRDVMLQRYYDAVEVADAELDSRELEAGAAAAERWNARLSSLLGQELQELRAVIAAIQRLDRRARSTCMECGELIDPSWMADHVSTTRCSDCAATQVMAIEIATSSPHSRPSGRAR